ncbi:hypothetical protein EJ074_20480 [Mesorhizobium sp. M3A.F.Ca.ET.080.04.2.1]|uniref:hypothetical protein n=1 Tax=Mesorhizobium sp. M3A.F.Ca.ET.080.04.2.1 TaxID=2493676 RepID=UPI000F763437|nr:hypothetical protein [Mesorhizobium sp. M3A.F.Ca.ET.080.04.2.1]AZO11199.1 hypothetical protein EJ074_20480 [Mesorhizobium sp. M3A.F.Ca.ET.080.04.2.1]RWF23790.1 MAG: hypothetical protein EOS64_10090 [Mesorhizobium sp.]
MMTALLSLDLTPAADAYDSRIADAWRISSQDVGEAIRFVRQSLKVIAETDEMLTPTVRLHSAAFVDQCRKRLPWELSLYLEHVRRVSECEAEMEARGMPFARSSHAWEA